MENERMGNIVTVREAVRRCGADGLQVSESALRRWIKTGELPVRKVGSKSLIFYPALCAFLRCSAGGDNQPATVAEQTKIRRLEVHP